MMEKTIKMTGKTVATLAIIVAGSGAFLVSIVHSLPAETQGMVNAFAILLVAIGAYLAHKDGSV
jgi:hypothetical protein